MPSPRLEVLGVRHHGPGSARSVLAALEEAQPDALLVEGPADADPLIRLLAAEDAIPPVALLAYAAEDPRTAVFWPFAVFSPEWQAITWAVRRGITVRFCDLPAATVLSRWAAESTDDGEAARRPRVRVDPIGWLAEAAGYDDPERWWEDVVEQRGVLPPERQDAATPGAAALAGFGALTQAMAAVRAEAPEASGPEETRREAFMRAVIRDVQRGGAERVVVVCGAWHAPALAARFPAATADAAVLRGRPKRKVALTLVPWTHSRLSAASGYGAGITSPGWYHHLFTTPDRPITRWLVEVAGVLRRADLPVSSAHVIEAVRLAEALAVLRGRPLAGLAEVTEATRSVLCEGNDVALDLVTRRLVVGEAMGSVPPDAPTVPLEADLDARSRRLRLRREPTPRRVDLDLRTPGGLDRSRLLHQLGELGVAWGRVVDSEVRSTGTFRESWELEWAPSLAIDVIEASTWGTTVEEAATARLAHRAEESGTLADLTAAVERCLLAALPDALPPLLAALDARAAGDLDVSHLMEALPALARSLRYGDVRGTDTGALRGVTDALLARIVAGLPAAVGALDESAAAALAEHATAVHGAVALLNSPADREQWLDVLAALAGRDDVHGLLGGRFTRWLRDAGRLDPQAAAIRLSRALSWGQSPAGQAAWIEGFLGGSGMELAHDAELLRTLDGWLGGLVDEDFTAVLPLLRRAFADFGTAERRIIAEHVRRLSGGAAGAWDAVTDDIDLVRARPAVRTVARLLGVGG